MRNLVLTLLVLFTASISQAKSANQCPTKNAQDTFWAAVKANNLAEVKTLVACPNVDVNKSYFYKYSTDETIVGSAVFWGWLNKSYDVAAYLAQLPEVKVNVTVAEYMEDNGQQEILYSKYLASYLLRAALKETNNNDFSATKNILNIIVNRNDFDPTLESIQSNDQASTYSVTYNVIDDLPHGVANKTPDIFKTIINHKNQKINDLICVEDCTVRRMSILELAVVVINYYSVYYTAPLVETILSHKDLQSSTINSPHMTSLLNELCGWPEYWPGGPQKEVYETFVADSRYEINRTKNHRGSIEAPDLVAAASCGALAAVEILMTRKDLNINAVDKDGHTALYYAQSKGYTKIADLIKKNGGR